MNNRSRALSKIYSRDYKNTLKGKRSVYYSMHDLYPPLFNFKDLPRKKKKQAIKDFKNRFIQPKKYQQSKQDIAYIDTDNKLTKELFHFYQSDKETHKIALASLYGKPKLHSAIITGRSTGKKYHADLYNKSRKEGYANIKDYLNRIFGKTKGGK